MRLSAIMGVTIDELIAATGWLAHTTRAALTGLRNRGYAVAIDRSDDKWGSFYRIPADEVCRHADIGVGEHDELVTRHRDHIDKV